MELNGGRLLNTLTCRVPAIIDHPQIACFYHDHSQSLGGGQERQGDHQLAQFNFRVLFAACCQVLPHLHLVREVHVCQGNLSAADANVPRVRVKVVQQHLQRTSPDHCWALFEYKVLVENWEREQVNWGLV